MSITGVQWSLLGISKTLSPFGSELFRADNIGLKEMEPKGLFYLTG